MSVPLVPTTPYRGLLHRVFVATVTWVFIDSLWIHRWWGCHRLQGRSFSVDGRQFHVCARCTGLIAGALLSALLLPWRHFMPAVFATFSVGLLIDGLSQYAGYRVSNNAIRFATGFGTGITLLSTMVSLGGI